MNPILLYITRTMIISGLLYAYYAGFLRNARFHRYNRCFLLGIPVFALTIPLLHIPIPGLQEGLSAQGTKTGIMHALTTGNWQENAVPGGAEGPVWAWPAAQTLALGLYLLVAGIFLTILIRSILAIMRLSRRYPSEQAGGIRIFLTREPGTPFSFLDRIFWNSLLDLHSARGKQVFRHELYHVRQRHSIDILTIECLRAFCWFNPFFHLIRRELKATHEFMADRYATSSSDRYDYAELLVWQQLGGSSPLLVHSFFNTHLKRRIDMLTQSTNKKPGYLRRIMILPLLFLLFCAFAMRLQGTGNPSGTPPVSTLTVVIDAGHGGVDPGATSAGGVQEKNLNLQIAKKVQQLAAAYNIHVLMTRDDDQMPGNRSTKEAGLQYRTDFAKENKADLFISIHMNNGAANPGGMEVYLSPQNPFFEKCARLGSAVIEEMKGTYPMDDELKQREQGIYVLKNTAMPAILIECGNMDNQQDFAFASEPQNQERIARSLLQGILRYEKEGPAAPVPPPPVPAVQ